MGEPIFDKSKRYVNKRGRKFGKGVWLNKDGTIIKPGWGIPNTANKTVIQYNTDGTKTTFTQKQWHDKKTIEHEYEILKNDRKYAIPFIPSKKTTITVDKSSPTRYNAGAVISENLLDSIAVNAKKAGLPFSTAIGIVAQESTLGHDKKRKTGQSMLPWLYVLNNSQGKIKDAASAISYNNVQSPSLLISNWKRISENPFATYLYNGKGELRKEERDADYYDRDFSSALRRDNRYKIEDISPLFQGFMSYKKDPYNYNPGDPDYPNKVAAQSKELVNYSPEIKAYMQKNNLYKEGGNMRDNNWDRLSYQDKADIMKVAVANGYTNLSDIRKEYNKFADGGDTDNQSPSINSNSEDSKYYAYMEKLAAKKAKDWKQNPDDTLLQMLNDNEYNYRAFWDYDRENAEKMLTEDPEAHFSDIGKTVYHPTFSNQSMYNGTISDYNPRGTVGGAWEDDDTRYVPSESQFLNKDIDLRNTQDYLRHSDSNVTLDLRNAPGTLLHTDNSYAGGGNLFKGGGVAHDARYNHATSIYQAYIDAGIPPQAALELTNQKVAEKGWTGWASGDNEKFSNLEDFVKHTIDYPSRMYPDTLKAENFNGFFNGLENGKYRYNPYHATYRNLLQQTRGGVKKRINEYRANQGLEPLALMNTPYSPPAIDGNYLVPQSETLSTEEPLLNLAAYGGNLFSKGGRKSIAIQANVPKAVNYLMSKGISRTGAAAIVGTLQAESGMNPAIHAMMKGDTGEGLAQWTGSRKKVFWKTLEKIEPGAQKKYKNVVNVPLERQLDVVLAERPEVTKAISNAKDVHTATDIMLRAYENGGGTVRNMASINQMNKIYGKWNNDYNTQMRKRVGNASKVLGIKFDPAMYASNNQQGQISDEFFTAFNNNIANTAAQAKGNEVIMQDPALSYKPTTIVMPSSEEKAEPKLSITYDPNEEKMNNIQKFNTIMGILGGGYPFSAMSGNTPSSNDSGLSMLPFIDTIYGK